MLRFKGWSIWLTLQHTFEAVHIPEANERMRRIHKDNSVTANGICE